MQQLLCKVRLYFIYRISVRTYNLICTYSYYWILFFAKENQLFDALSNVYQTDVWSVRCFRCNHTIG